MDCTEVVKKEQAPVTRRQYTAALVIAACLLSACVIAISLLFIKVYELQESIDQRQQAALERNKRFLNTDDLRKWFRRPTPSPETSCASCCRRHCDSLDRAEDSSAYLPTHRPTTAAGVTTQSARSDTTMQRSTGPVLHIKPGPATGSRRPDRPDVGRLHRPTNAHFIRWGKSTCSGESSVIYNGFAAAAQLDGNKQTSSSDIQCIPRAPGQPADTLISQNTTSQSLVAPVYIDKEVSDSSPSRPGILPCVVCGSMKSVVLTLPSSTSCPSAWRQEYKGLLMVALDSKGEKSSDYACVDDLPESVPGESNGSSRRMSHVRMGHCPSSNVLCGSHQQGKALSCIVCSSD